MRIRHSYRMGDYTVPKKQSNSFAVEATLQRLFNLCQALLRAHKRVIFDAMASNISRLSSKTVTLTQEVFANLMSTETTRLKQTELSAVFLNALGPAVAWHNGHKSKPLEVDINTLYPKRLRVYLYNATYPPGGRTLGERKIQLIVPGQPRGARGNLDDSNGRLVLLVGYEADVDIFILWDAGTYRNFPYSMNAQVNPETVYEAYSGKITHQTRRRRTPEPVDEVVICTPSELLIKAIDERLRLSIARIVGEEI